MLLEKEESGHTPLDETEFRKFRELIHELTGIALSPEKKQLVQSRLQKRLRHHGLSSFSAYYPLVASPEADSVEIAALINCITTNKTDFFREPHHFDFIRQHVLPARKASGETRLRIWHAGCSTGEEPYTLAMTLREQLGQRANWDIRQLASDIDTDVLAQAEAGIYREERLTPIPLDLRRRYFLRGQAERAHLYKVKPELQQWLTFRQINLLATDWPIRPDVRFDMIFCRNVVIYFDKPTQRRLFARFEERLQPGGFLFIGHSESLIGITSAFEAVGQTVYRKPLSEPMREAA